MSRLRAAPIRDALATHPFYGRVVVAERLCSTNDEARRLAAQGAGEGTVVLADAQSAGRGRHGRSWVSTAGLGLYVSVVLRPGEEIEQVTRWTLAAAVAACEACRRASDEAVTIDWPNDLVHGERKLGGILAELRSSGGIPAELIIGLGINVHHREEDWPPSIAGRATSLHLIGGRGILERELIAVDYLERLAGVAAELRGGKWSRIAARWESLAPGARGCRGRIVSGRGADRGTGIVGVTCGLDADGALVVEDESGRRRALRTVESFVPQE